MSTTYHVPRTEAGAEWAEIVGAEASTASNVDKFWKTVDRWAQDQPNISLEFRGPIEGTFNGTVSRTEGKTVTFHHAETEEEQRVNFDEATVRLHSFSQLNAVCSFCALWVDESTLQTATCVLTELQA